MAHVFACELPENLWFDVQRDVWVLPLPDGTARVGMTDPAQTRAGRILHVRVRPGREVALGKSVASIESAKWVGPVPAPFAAAVMRGNSLLEADPGLINRDPYGDGWLAQLRPAAAADWGGFGLLTGEAAVDAYRQRLQAEKLHCVRCADPSPDA